MKNVTCQFCKHIRTKEQSNTVHVLVYGCGLTRTRLGYEYELPKTKVCKEFSKRGA